MALAGGGGLAGARNQPDDPAGFSNTVERNQKGGPTYYLTDKGNGYLRRGARLYLFRDRGIFERHRDTEEPLFHVKEAALLKACPAPAGEILDVKRESRRVGGLGITQRHSVPVPRGWELGWWDTRPAPADPDPAKRPRRPAYSEKIEKSPDGKTDMAFSLTTTDCPRDMTVVVEKRREPRVRR
jgi:hypothetical protein